MILINLKKSNCNGSIYRFKKISFKEFVISYQGVIISLVKVKELPKELETNHLFNVMISSIFKTKDFNNFDDT